MRPCVWIFGLFNSYANDAGGLEMVRKYGVARSADGARQTTRPGGRKEDAGTHNPPAHSTMNLTNADKLKRDARSMLKVGWDVDRITQHFISNPDDYGTGLRYDEIHWIVDSELDDMNRAARKANAELRVINCATRAAVRDMVREIARNSKEPLVREIVAKHFRITL